jgi:hypothetical protein
MKGTSKKKRNLPPAEINNFLDHTAFPFTKNSVFAPLLCLN